MKKLEMMDKQKNRIQTFDVLKAIAIIAVVYTHCLQFLGIENYWHHPIFKFTYAFHMPLFMLISGYFANRALQLPFKQLFRKKCVQLILPCLTAGVVVIAVNQLTGWAPKHAGLREFVSNLWYLKSLFLCFCIAKLAWIGSKGKVWSTIGIGILMALPVHLYHVNFMMPFFMLGLAWSKYPEIIRKHVLRIFIISLLAFVILWQWWDGFYTTYATPLQFVRIHTMEWLGFTNFPAYVLRTAIGIVGSGVIISCVYLLEKFGLKFDKMSRMGQYTLELYTLHFLFIHTGIMTACRIAYQEGWYELGYCGLATVILFGICFLLIKLIHCSKWLSLLFFGK